MAHTLDLVCEYERAPLQRKGEQPPEGRHSYSATANCAAAAAQL
jgi:hypothetical protein